MKAKSIITIEDILRQKKEEAKANYKSVRAKFEEKYNTEWLDKIMEPEKKMLEKARENYYELEQLYDDFDQHQWWF